MIDNFPTVLKSIYDSGRPELQNTIPMLQNMFATDPNKAATAAMEIITKLDPGEIKVHDVPGTDGKYVTQGKKFVAQFKGASNSKQKTALFGSKALERMKKENPDFNVQETNVNNLALKLNADGSIESYYFIEPNEKLTVTEQTQYNNLVEKYNAQIKQRSESGNLHMLGSAIQKDARSFINEYQPIIVSKARYDSWLGNLQKMYDKGDIYSETYNLKRSEAKYN